MENEDIKTPVAGSFSSTSTPGPTYTWATDTWTTESTKITSKLYTYVEKPVSNQKEEWMYGVQ